MLPDIARLRAELAHQRRALWQLDIVEAAEHVVRSHHRQLLDEELADLHLELARAQQTLAMARDGDDLTFIVVTEERICALQRQAADLQRQSRAQDVADARMRTDYLAERQQLAELVSLLQRLLVRSVRRSV